MNKRMKAILCATLAVVIIVVAALMIWKYIDEKKRVADARIYVVWGNVIELKEDNYMLLELTKADVGFEIGDKVLVKYKEVNQWVSNEGYIVVEPRVGDDIIVQYFETYTHDGYKCIKEEGIFK